MMTVSGGKSARRCSTAQSRRAIAGFLLASSFCVDYSGATTLPVLNCADDGNAGTLRSVIATAATGDTIDLSGLTCPAITLTSGELAVPLDDLSVSGPGISNLRIDAVHASRVFNHTGSGTLGLSGMTITGGTFSATSAAHGGCIESAANVSLDHVVVTDCEVAGDTSPAGGGLYVTVHLMLESSVISANRAMSTGSGGAYPSSMGGGLWARSLTALNSSITANTALDPEDHQASGGGVFVSSGIFVRYSTIDSNNADFGGGLTIGPATSVMALSTVSGNTAGIQGGGVFAQSGLNLFSSTVAFNTSGMTAGGIYGQGVYGLLYLKNSIVASNESPDTANADIDGDRGQFNSGFSVSGDLHDIVMHSTLYFFDEVVRSDPMLGPLSDHGGPTLTHALLPGSPAIDSGDTTGDLPSSGACDQRKQPRVRGVTIDIGPYEDQADSVFVDRFDGCV